MHKRMITSVALKVNDEIFSLPAPSRHYHIFAEYEGQIEGKMMEQGFLDVMGNYLTRQEAYIVAKETNQLKRRIGEQFYQGDQLFSEDLW